MALNMSAEVAAPEEVAEKPKRQRTFRVIRADERPAEALTWRTHRERAHLFRQWRRSIWRRLGSHPRALRVAWALEALISSRGYAFPSDSFLARETALHIEGVQLGLMALAREGAIVRCHAPLKRGGYERRLYPGKTILEGSDHTATVAVTPYCHGEAKPYATLAVENIKEPPSRLKSRVTITQAAARAAAESRAARERGEPAKTWTDD